MCGVFKVLVVRCMELCGARWIVTNRNSMSEKGLFSLYVVRCTITVKVVVVVQMKNILLCKCGAKYLCGARCVSGYLGRLLGGAKWSVVVRCKWLGGAVICAVQNVVRCKNCAVQ